MITGLKIVAQARTWIGTSFHHQGRLKACAGDPGGCDCIGLVVGVMQELGIKLAAQDKTDYSALPDGRRLKEALDGHLKSVPRAFIRPGDILLFSFAENPQHVGIATNYAAGGLGLIHCYASSKTVVEHYYSANWQRRLVAAYRFKKKDLSI
jgi:NlpC/P60 family putative phage cell wall peptidase